MHCNWFVGDYGKHIFMGSYYIFKIVDVNKLNTNDCKKHYWYAKIKILKIKEGINQSHFDNYMLNNNYKIPLRHFFNLMVKIDKDDAFLELL